MSFVEANKTWILPLLGLGAATVIWLNVRTFNQPSPTAQELPHPAATAPAPQATPEAPPTPVLDEALWDDLRAVAFVPADLETRTPFEQKALSGLSPQAYLAPRPLAVIRRSGAEPARDFRPTVPQDHAKSQPGPPPDFLIDGPNGPQAWFDGHGYRTGQPLKGRPFAVKAISLTPTLRVTLEGSKGPASRSTRPIPVQEVP
jgi:hypothetical protein